MDEYEKNLKISHCIGLLFSDDIRYKIYDNFDDFMDKSLEIL